VAAAPPPDPLAHLDEVTRRLRRECPWDRDQDARSIVSHTVEEAYELADAAHSGDDARQLDELGDVLFQVHFLSLLLEERGTGTLAAVAEHCTEKLIRRHPHVFGEAQARDAGEVLRNWDAIKLTEAGRRPGLFGEMPENLPGLLYARKHQRRAASGAPDLADVPAAAQAVRDQLVELERAGTRERHFEELGDLLFAVVHLSRKLSVDPELALRAATRRFRERLQAAEAHPSSGRP